MRLNPFSLQMQWAVFAEKNITAIENVSKVVAILVCEVPSPVARSRKPSSLCCHRNRLDRCDLANEDRTPDVAPSFLHKTVIKNTFLHNKL